MGGAGHGQDSWSPYGSSFVYDMSYNPKVGFGIPDFSRLVGGAWSGLSLLVGTPEEKAQLGERKSARSKAGGATIHSILAYCSYTEHELDVAMSNL